jgi:two-component system NarL family sensor kinase
VGASVLTAAPDRKTAARSEARAVEPTGPRPDPRERAESDLDRLADGLLKMLEADRAHVAGVLSNEIVSVMTIARYLIEDAGQRVSRGELDQTCEALKNASTRIRDATCRLLALCSDLRPKVLDDLGLLPALCEYLRDFSHNYRAIFVSPRITVTEGDVPTDLKLVIFRIVQAALSNVARHSKASTVRVFLSIFEDELRLGIEDNGVGFDVERWRHGRNARDGCGLGMILRWVETSGGRCLIEATPRHGARLQAFWRIPLSSSATSRPHDEQTPRASGTPPDT